MRHLVLFSLLITSLFASEPSAFGAGNLDSPNPYGLTHEEKLILESNKKIETIAHKNSLQTAKVESVTERLDGIQAIVEGLSQGYNEQKIALAKLSDASQEGNKTNDIEELLALNKTNGDNILQLKMVVEELSKVVDGINSTYVTKEEFAALVKQLKVTMPAGTPNIPKKMDNASIEKEAKKLFDNQKYLEAQSYYEMMIQKKYKQAEANFWIGECYFEQNKHKEAVGYYKQSASLNEKSSVMPTLLLHTGISLEKMGDKDKAKSFYNATISRYGSTGAAADAKEKLAKLK
jgi:TolA-binding protein